MLQPMGSQRVRHDLVIKHSNNNLLNGVSIYCDRKDWFKSPLEGRE